MSRTSAYPIHPRCSSLSFSTPTILRDAQSMTLSKRPVRASGDLGRTIIRRACGHSQLGPMSVERLELGAIAEIFVVMDNEFRVSQYVWSEREVDRTDRCRRGSRPEASYILVHLPALDESPRVCVSLARRQS